MTSTLPTHHSDDHNEIIETTPKTASTESQQSSGTPLAPTQDETPLTRDQKISIVKETIIQMLVIVTVVLGIRYAVLSPFRVSGNSMFDTLFDKEFILVERVSYWLSDPQFGDVVVLHPLHAQDDHTYYVKRVIGTPGDTLEFKNGSVYVYNDTYKDGRLVPEDFLAEVNQGKTYLPSRANKKVTLVGDEYFVMGDNRKFSSDSRTWFEEDTFSHGAVKKSNIVGKVWMSVFPNFGLVDDLK